MTPVVTLLADTSGTSTTPSPNPFQGAGTPCARGGNHDRQGNHDGPYGCGGGRAGRSFLAEVWLLHLWDMILVVVVLVVHQLVWQYSTLASPTSY